MNLVFVGESGNTGGSVNDPNQYHHIYTGLMVHEDQCISLNGEFDALYQRHIGSQPGSPGVPLQLKAADIYQGRGFFKSWSPERRGDLIKDCLELLIRRRTPNSSNSGILATVHTYLGITTPSSLSTNSCLR